MTTIKFGTRPLVHLSVYGTPAPQGSKTAYARKSKDGKMFAQVVESQGKGRDSHVAWRQAVATAARDWQSENHMALLDGPLRVTIEFWFDRPKSKPKWKQYPDVKPDIDKLVRSVLDSLSGLVIKDDSRVVYLTCIKQYAGDRPPGAEITVDLMQEGPTERKAEYVEPSEQDLRDMQVWEGDV